jgi:hypothetical protein
METIRDDGQAGVDERLGTAMTLLQKPRNGRPGYVPLLAACAFIGAATFLAYIVTKTQNPSKAAPVQAVQKSVAVNKADFELSATSPSASVNEMVSEAVPLGSESAR